MSTPDGGRYRRLAYSTGLGAWRVLRRHYFSFASAGVIAVLFGLVMTSESFVSENQRTRPAPTVQEEPRSRITIPKRRRLHAVYFVVDSEEQRASIAEAITADQTRREGGVQAYDFIVYLIAGTREQESRAIARLDFDASLAQLNGVDMRVVDVRTQPAR